MYITDRFLTVSSNAALTHTTKKHIHATGLCKKLMGYIALTISALAIIECGTVAHAAGVVYSGNRYTTGTTNSAIYTSFDNVTTDSLITTRLTQGIRSLSSAPSEYFGYNVATATGGADGQRITNAAPYPAGYEFNTTLVQTGSGAGGNVSATFTGATVGTSAQAFDTNTWIKGATESGGAWNVLANKASMLGGYTNSTMVGSVTMDFTSAFTSWGTLIGTNTGANLNVSISAYDTTSATPSTAIFTYGVNNITHNTANPNFTGFTSTVKFNRVVITGLQTSTGAGNSTYTAYPNAAFIALDQVEAGQFQPVPTPPAAVSLAIGGLVGLVGTGVKRVQRKRKKA